MRHRVQLINQNRPPTSYIQQYAVYEHLGTGAFGSVYKVRPLIYFFFYFALQKSKGSEILELNILEYNTEFKFQNEIVLIERNQHEIHFKHT